MNPTTQFSAITLLGLIGLEVIAPSKDLEQRRSAALAVIIAWLIGICGLWL